jgi:UDP:flavonoid glycosyltransferase YjiC (YdhE family)
MPDWPPRTRVTGFLFRDSDFEGRGMDPALARFLAEGEPPVVFTLGSSAVMTADGFYRHAARAAGDLGVRAVLLAGSGAADLRDLPPGVAAFPSAPYHLLFPAASAVVHSGGIGTTAQVLRAGKPQIVVPFAHDQFDNAGRVRRRGLGGILGKKRATAGRMAGMLRGLLADGAVRARAREVGRRVSAEDGATAACDEIEAVLRG